MLYILIVETISDERYEKFQPIPIISFFSWSIPINSYLYIYYNLHIICSLCRMQQLKIDIFVALAYLEQKTKVFGSSNVYFFSCHHKNMWSFAINNNNRAKDRTSFYQHITFAVTENKHSLSMLVQGEDRYFLASEARSGIRVLLLLQ